MKTLMKFVRDEDGLTTVEYAVAGALVAAAVALAFQGLGTAVTTNIETLTSIVCLLYTSPSPRDQRGSRMPSSA